eukprot:3605429-Pleurochrysis_carterae.AAC.1
MRYVGQDASATFDNDVNLDDNDDGADYDDQEPMCSDCDDDAVNNSPARSAPKLWTASQFPRGFKGLNNYEMPNLLAALEWDCKCLDRSCLSTDRIPVLLLYDHRREWQLRASSQGGYRNTMRKSLEQHYSSETREFLSQLRHWAAQRLMRSSICTC